MKKLDSENPRPMKLCYEHIGGKLGDLMATAFIEKGWFARDDSHNQRHFYITPKGEKELTKLGIDLSQIKS